MGSSKSPTVQTQSTAVQQFPQYITDAQQGLQSYGQGMLSPFLGSAPNYAVAGQSLDTLMGQDLTREMAQNAFTGSSPQIGNTSYAPQGYTSSGYDPYDYEAVGMGNGQGYAFAGSGGAATYDPRIAGNAANYAAANATAAQTGAGDYQQFMNPFIEAVIDPAMQHLSQAHADNSATIGAQAAASGAFGGSADAIRQAQNDRAFGDQTSTMVGQLLSQGYSQAQAQAAANAALRQQTALANQSAENQAGQFNASANNAMAVSNAGMINQAGQFNAGNIQADRQFNSTAANQAAAFGATAANNAANFNAAAQNAARAADAAAHNTALAFGANAENTAKAFNATAANSAGYQNSALALQRAQLEDALYGSRQSRQQQITQMLMGNGTAEQQFMQQILGIPQQALATLGGITPTQVPTTTNTAGTQPNTQPSLLQQLLGAGTTLGAAVLKP